MTTELDFGPARFSSITALLSGLGVVTVVGSLSVLSAIGAVLGLVAVGIGIRKRTRIALSAGLMLFWLAVLLAALAGLSAEFVAISFVLAGLSWDSSNRALTVGQQLTATANTRRIESVHAFATLAVGLGSYCGVYLLEMVAPRIVSPGTLVALVLATGILITIIEMD